MLRSKQAGFTLIELLVATAVGAILLLIINQILIATAQGQSRAEVSLPLQQSVRGSGELIDMNLREANGVRVLTNDPSNVPSALLPYASSATRLTVVSSAVGNSFSIQQPLGYGSGQGSVAAGNTTPLASIAYADPSTNPPTTVSNSCGQIFKGGEWFLRLEPVRPVLQPDGTYQMPKGPGGAPVPNTVRWGQASASSPCTGNTLSHPAYSWPSFNWTPSAAVLKLDITSYYLGTVGSVPVLYRQLVGQTPQVVAFDITAMQVQYSADGQTFGATPLASPVAVRVALTATAGRQPLGPGSLPNYSASVTTFMRKTTIQVPDNSFSSGY